MTRRRSLAILCAVSALAFPAFAANAPTDPPAAGPAESPVVPGLMMPARENALVTILTNAARQYTHLRTASQKAEARLAMQISVSKFMRESQEAHGWVGLIRASHRTTEGDIWLSIAIAPEIVLSTLQDRFQDDGYQTLIRASSPLQSTVAEEMPVGQAVIFDGTMLIFDVSDNDGLIERPQIVTRFQKIDRADNKN